MPKIQPESVADEAFAELSQLLVENVETVDEMRLARLERAAKSGLATNARLAYQSLGLVALFKGDRVAVEEKFGAALRLSSGGEVESNYSSVLMTMNRFGEAAQMADKASVLEPANLRHLRSAIETNWYAGRWERSLELIATLKSRAPNEEVASTARNRSRVVKCLKETGVSMDTVERLHTALYEFLAAKRIRSRGAEQFIDTSTGEEAVYINIAIDRASDEVRELDEELTPVLFDAVDEFPVGSFYIGLSKFNEDKHVA